MGIDTREIIISKATFTKLANWASVGRTIDAAVELLGEIEERGNIDLEAINYVIEELVELKPALDEVSCVCTETYHHTLYKAGKLLPEKV